MTRPLSRIRSTTSASPVGLGARCTPPAPRGAIAVPGMIRPPLYRDRPPDEALRPPDDAFELRDEAFEPPDEAFFLAGARRLDCAFAPLPLPLRLRLPLPPLRLVLRLLAGFERELERPPLPLLREPARRL